MIKNRQPPTNWWLISKHRKLAKEIFFSKATCWQCQCLIRTGLNFEFDLSVWIAVKESKSEMFKLNDIAYAWVKVISKEWQFYETEDNQSCLTYEQMWIGKSEKNIGMLNNSEKMSNNFLWLPQMYWKPFPLLHNLDKENKEKSCTTTKYLQDLQSYVHSSFPGQYLGLNLISKFLRN